MWEAAAYSQNIFKVMLDPATWLIAAIMIFGFRRWPLSRRVIIALGVNATFMLIWRVWPHGSDARIYGWIAFGYELAATAVWLGIFIGAARLFGRRTGT